MLAIDGVPAWRIIVSSSRFRMSITASTPALAECREPPHLRPADADRCCAQRERFEDVRAAPNAAIDEYGHTASHGR